MSHGLTLQRIINSYTSSALAGNIEGASAAVDRALNELCLSPASIYLELLSPAQMHVGLLWERGRINIAEEHLATQITMQQMDRIRPHFRRKRDLALSAAASSVYNEQHTIGIRMVADFLFEDGWEVDFLGAGIPHRDFVSFVDERRSDLVVLSVTLTDSLAGLRQLAGMLRELPGHPKIIAGGPALESSEAASLVPEIDAVAFDALDAVRKVRMLFELETASVNLDELLVEIGKRIQSARKQRQMSQQQLANAAGLDRAYISQLERGKNNISLGAVVKLSNALGVSHQDLLSGPIAGSSLAAVPWQDFSRQPSA